jgi:hypothetical protein
MEMPKILVAAVLVLLLHSTAYATIFFDDDFETPPNIVGQAPVDWPDQTPNATPECPVSNTDRLTGSNAVRFDYNSITGTTTNCSVTRFIAGIDHMFLRLAYRVVTGFQIGSNGLTKIMFVGALNNPGGVLELEGDPGSTIGSLMLDVYPYDTLDVQRLHTNTVITDGAWHQIEVEILLNTPGVSNGVFRVWIDNVLKMESLNRQIRGPLPTSVTPYGVPAASTATLSLFQLYRQSGLGTTYYDRIAVADARIGPVGTSPSPGTPANLNVAQLFGALLALGLPLAAVTWCLLS